MSTPQDGITLRDFFAAKTLNGRLSNPQANRTGPKIRSEKKRLEREQRWAAAHARKAYLMADAMLAERTKGQPK